MIPAPFDYVRPDTLAGAIDALAEHGDDAKVLAGGHSLLPLMKLRFAFPRVLVDVGRIDELRGVRDDGDHLSIGAATTHAEVIAAPLVQRHCPLLTEVAAVIGDPQVRHRGTIGGALAHGDAAGDLPAAALALDADLVAAGPDGRRTIPAVDFFLDYLTTALDADEVLVEVRVPKLGDGWGHDYQKFARSAQAWAIVGSCALVERTNGTIRSAKVGLTHMGSVPLRASATEQVLRDVPVSEQALRDAAGLAADGTDPPSDLNADAAYRRHLARVMTRRALFAAVRTAT